MKYDDTIKRSITRACDMVGRLYFSERVGFSRSMVSMIFSGRATGCVDAKWEKMYPLLIEHGDLDPNLPQYWPRSKLLKSNIRIESKVIGPSPSKSSFTGADCSVIRKILVGEVDITKQYGKANDNSFNKMPVDAKKFVLSLYDNYMSLPPFGKQIVNDVLGEFKSKDLEACLYRAHPPTRMGDIFKRILSLPEDKLKMIEVMLDGISAQSSSSRASTPPDAGAK